MILPSSIPNKKLIVIDQVLKQCQLERNPMACEEIVDEFNDLRSDIILLFDLKNALNSAEYELQTSLHRLKHENGPMSAGILSAQPLSSSSTSSNDASRTVNKLLKNLFKFSFYFLAF
jgi:DNA methyltransferase 1-associated protein 1